MELEDSAAGDASVLAHRLEGCLLGSFRRELTQVDDEERRTHRDGEAVFEDLRMSNLQHRAGVEDGTENDMAVNRVRFGGVDSAQVSKSRSCRRANTASKPI